MDRRAGSAYMERAIDKASRLIDLLTKENNDLRTECLALNGKLESFGVEAGDRQRLQGEVKKLKESIGEKELSLQRNNRQLSELREKFQEKVNKNKQLHEKLADFSSKNQELTKKLEAQVKKNLSLQNQNQYLLKTYTKHQQKQNKFQNYCFLAEQQFKKQMIQVDRTKQAFARKCEQLRVQNLQLKQDILIVSQQLLLLKQSSAQHLKNSQKLHQIQKQIKRANDILAYIIESTLKTKPETGLLSKVEQIKTYVGYRLQHIENLLKPVCEILGNSEGGLKDLESLNSTVNRLSTYLGELVR